MIRLNSKLLIVVPFLIFGLNSCYTPYTYIQSAPSVPLIDDKKQFQINGFIKGNFMELQNAGSFINHWGYIFDCTILRSADNPCTFYELGTGYYLKLKNKHIIDCYVGFGKGTLNALCWRSFLTSAFLKIQYQLFYYLALKYQTNTKY